MPNAGWWEALWPDPAGVLASVGVKPNMAVMDLCAGDGWFTLQIAKLARHVVAIDIDTALLEVARHRLSERGSPTAISWWGMLTNSPAFGRVRLILCSLQTPSMAFRIEND